MYLNNEYWAGLRVKYQRCGYFLSGRFDFSNSGLVEWSAIEDVDILDKEYIWI